MATPDINKILRATLRPCRYGAPMGARDAEDGGLQGLYLQRVRFVDGDYAPDGTYWGGGRGAKPLWCAFSACGKTRLYGRGNTRSEALDAILRLNPDVTLRKPLRGLQ